LIEEISGESFGAFFADYIEGTESLEPLLQEMGEYYGLKLRSMPLGNLSESAWGLRVQSRNDAYQVEALLPHSPWLAAGLHPGDEIVSINGQKLMSNWNELLAYHWEAEEIVFHVFHQQKLRVLRLNHSRELRYRVPQFWLTANQEASQRARINHWRSLPAQTTT
jgi:predicted metalloprotease with PDZ domain